MKYNATGRNFIDVLICVNVNKYVDGLPVVFYSLTLVDENMATQSQSI